MVQCTSCGFRSDGSFTFCPRCGAAFAIEPLVHEQRKIVTVVFCDLTDSTALGESLDPERLRAVLAGYFERMKGIVDRHEGSVEKFIGDAVMAVFGVPTVHEDDALRAVRAAAEMRVAMPELGLRARIGVNTGEVVTGTEERLATGDAVNVAARLEQAARPDEILIGERTLALVGGALDVEPVEPLELKGKRERVPAYRLVSVHDVPTQPPGTLFVGRDRERSLLHQVCLRVRADAHCELFTILGEAGVGKSRLVAEALASEDATIVLGRCLPYGDGITYWPVVEVLKQLAVMPPSEDAAATVEALLGEGSATTSAEEIAWAFRKTLEAAAATRPVIVVFDDIQWGEETFLDLIEHVTLLSSGASILLLCIARQGLVDRRPAWPVALELGPLGREDVDALVPTSLAEELREKITGAAGGNPLFVEEMVAMAAEAEGTVAIPPTLHALLAARLDQLEVAERSVLECASVEGEIFHRGAVQALTDSEAHVTARLAALVRKGLIKPHRPQFDDEDGFRFRHLLIRDVAYEALPKALRAQLHERFAAWLGSHGARRVELDEIAGYHLERACGYRADLGMPRDDELADAARRHLTSAGRRAYARADYGAAAGLLERAANLADPDETDLALETDLIEGMYWEGRVDDALRRADAVARRASAAGNEVDALCAEVQEWIIRSYLVQPEDATERLDRLVETALPVFRDAGDDLALYTAYRARGTVAFDRALTDAAFDAYELAADHAHHAGLAQDFLEWRSASCFYGTAPVSAVLAWLDTHIPRTGRYQWLKMYRGLALGMLGRFAEGRALLVDTRDDLAERGGGLRLAVTMGIESVDFEMLAGDPDAAVALGAEGCRMLEGLAEKSFLSTAAASLARALYARDRLEEADDWARRSSELGGQDDAFTQALWRQVGAKVLARRGDHTQALSMAREAQAILASTDFLNGQGDASADLAEVLVLAKMPNEASAALTHAFDCYERKGNQTSAQLVSGRMAALTGAQA